MRRSWLREHGVLSCPCPSLQLHALGAGWLPVQTIPLLHTPGVNTRVHLPRADPAQRPGLFQRCCTNVHVAPACRGSGLPGRVPMARGGTSENHCLRRFPEAWAGCSGPSILRCFSRDS